MGRRAEAIGVLAAGGEYHPDDPDLAAKLAPLLTADGRHAEAQAVLAGALGAAPGRTDLHRLLAAEYAADLRLDEALRHLTAADRLTPDHPAILSSIGVLHQALGNLDAAIQHHRRATELAPDSHQAHVNLATAFLTRFDLDNGFAALERRLALPQMPRPNLTAPRWRGEPLEGRRLLVTAEQGLGDIIQFARFLPDLSSFGGEVVVECPDELARLFATLPGIAACTRLGDPTPQVDVTIPILSLPFILGCTAERLTGDIPYLGPLPDSHFDLPSGNYLKVGLVWAAKPGVGEVYVRRSLDRRSCPLDVLAPLTEIPGIRVYSLQKGEAVAALPRSGLPIQDLGSGLGDLADTAAAIAALDLIISVDTSVAHLAGAMGKPLWVLLAPGQADYRWGMGSDSTAWYPQARLFRASPAGWASLIPTVARKLALMVRNR
jgi:tetratricopeptide (TPR) repeat protein